MTLFNVKHLSLKSQCFGEEGVIGQNQLAQTLHLYSGSS